MYHVKSDFSGNKKKVLNLNGGILSELEYHVSKSTWHFHEHCFFSLVLDGIIIEKSKKINHQCTRGTLLFQNWEEPNYHECLQNNTKSFMVELPDSIFENFDLDKKKLEGSIQITNPEIKIHFHNLYKETKINSGKSNIYVESLLVSALSFLKGQLSEKKFARPPWIKIVDEMLHSCDIETISLKQLAASAGIHPVHLCRDFRKYYHCTLGEYIRKIKIEKALSQFTIKNKSLTDIAFECGFADQSHFIRCFKQINRLTPLQYRKIISNK